MEDERWNKALIWMVGASCFGIGMTTATTLYRLAALAGSQRPTVEQRTISWNSASELEQMGFAFGANIIVLSGDDGLSGYARLRDSSRTWVSSGSDETRVVHGASIGEVHARLADEMRPGVK